MKKLIPFSLFILLVWMVNAQDPHLSQFYTAPMYLNPALTGAFEGNYRASFLFRNQWGTIMRNEQVPGYHTYTASAEIRTNRGIMRGDAIGVGISFLGDKASDSKYGYNCGGIAVAYHKVLDAQNKNYLVAGFSSQLYQQTADFSNLQFGTQWDGSGYNSSLSNNEFSLVNRKVYWDINAGMLWYMSGIGKKHRSNAYLGVSAFHLNRPSVSMMGNEQARLNIKYTVHGGISLAIGSRCAFQPKFIFMSQGHSVETVFAADIRYQFSNQQQGSSLHLGGMLRMVANNPGLALAQKGLTPEAIILSAGVSWKGLDIHVAYDSNVSSLMNASKSVGGFEAGLSYTGQWNKRTGHHVIYCPKF